MTPSLKTPWLEGKRERETDRWTDRGGGLVKNVFLTL